MPPDQIAPPQTAIVYLNPGWDASRDGGALRVYYPRDEASNGLERAHESESFADIEPVAGRLILFDSRRIEHEVRPTHATRWALTLWAGVDL